MSDSSNLSPPPHSASFSSSLQCKGSMAGGEACKCQLSLEKLLDPANRDLLLERRICTDPNCRHDLGLHPSTANMPSKPVSPKTPSPTISKLSVSCNGGVPGGTCDKGCLHFVKANNDNGDSIVRCICGHTENNHALPPSSFLTPPASRPKTPAKESRDKGSFRKQLIARLFQQKTVPEGKSLHCHICNDAINNAAHGCHIVDLNLIDQFDAMIKEFDPNEFPVSINHPNNGLLLCPTCHHYFDHKERLIRILKDGTIQCHQELLDESSRYKALHGTKVWWADKIGSVNWPSSAFLNWANTLPKGFKSTKKLKPSAIAAVPAAAGEEEEESSESAQDSESETDEDDPAEEFNEKNTRKVGSLQAALAFLKEAKIDEKDCKEWLDSMFTKKGDEKKRKRNYQVEVPRGYRYISDKALPDPWYAVILKPRGSELWFNPETNQVHLRLRGG